MFKDIENFLEPIVNDSKLDFESLPPVFLKENTQILKDDFYRKIAEWYVHSLYIPKPSYQITYHDILYDVNDTLINIFGVAEQQENQTSLIKSAKLIARLITYYFVGSKDNRRINIDYETKESLIADGSRCQICGYKFPKESINIFLGLNKTVPAPNEYIDFLKPIRYNSDRMQIDIDHIHPISRGGDNSLDNLQLLCRFCNKSKRHYLNIFDIGSLNFSYFDHPKKGKISIPQTYYLVRTLIDSECYKCQKSANDKELTIFLKNLEGHANPLNISTTCYECDPIKDYRHVNRSHFN